MGTKEKIGIAILVTALAAATVFAVWTVINMKTEGERDISCQRRCEPRRWKILEEHCYCRDQPDEWHGIDKDKEPDGTRNR